MNLDIFSCFFGGGPAQKSLDSPESIHMKTRLVMLLDGSVLQLQVNDHLPSEVHIYTFFFNYAGSSSRCPKASAYSRYY